MRVGIVWECPWVPSSYGKVVAWLVPELQRAGFDVRVYCPSIPDVMLYSKHIAYTPSCLHKGLGVCVEYEKPVEVSSDRWVCEDEDVDAYVIGGSPYGHVEAGWVSKCSKSRKPVAGYFVTESDVVPPLLSSWLLHVDAVGFPARAVAEAFLTAVEVREAHKDWVHAPHGLPNYYFSLTPDEILEYGLGRVGKSRGLELAIESRSAGRLFGAVAKDHPRKDFGALLTAFTAVRDSAKDPKVRLLLGRIAAVGCPAWDVGAMMASLGLSGDEVLTLEDKWVVSGVTEMGLLFMYSLMNVHVTPTLGEGFGLQAVESASLGVPPIITETPVTREVWEGYSMLVRSRPILVGEGFILHATDYGDLAEKMSSMLDPGVRDGSARVAKNIARGYTSEVMGKSVAKLIELALRKEGTKRPHPLPNYPTEPTEEYRRKVREVINLLRKKE